MKIWGKVFFISVFLWVFTSPIFASSNSIKNIRTGTQSDDFTRLVIETTNKPDYKFYYENPNKIICEIPNTDINKLSKTLGKNNLVSKVAVTKCGNKKTTAKIAFSLTDSAMPTEKKQLMLLDGNKNKNYRLVLDIKKTNKDNFKTAISKKASASKGNISPYFFADKNSTLNLSSKETGFSLTDMNKQKSEKAKKIIETEDLPKLDEISTTHDKPIIVIDAGHGGKDPGCRGKNGTKEKDIVLSIARQLKKSLLNTGKYEVHLTRDSDIFLNLGTRASIGEKYHADLFISIHANANPSRKIKGYSVYTLSKTASDEEAAKLAEAENASDRIAVDGFEKYEPFVKMALGSLQQQIVAEESLIFANEIKKTHKQENILAQANKPVRSAAFAVLKSSTPSVLLEIGHLSNPSEEKLLRSSDYQKKIVKAVTKAIGNYEFD